MHSIVIPVGHLCDEHILQIGAFVLLTVWAQVVLFIMLSEHAADRVDIDIRLVLACDEEDLVVRRRKTQIVFHAEP